MRCLATM
ncbi:hypothetical protein LINPERPRIM_LOCUS40214 [Linum perenne]